RDRLGADGLLGVDVLQQRRLIMDFRRRRLQIVPSSDDRPLARYRTAKIPTSDRHGLLSVIDVRAERVGATALVDTGGSVTIANRDLARRMRQRGAWATA
ncbi:MAG TPA: peptidase A2A, partial [Caulobacter sp.]|nr:peptidase A2A [Caulobacter sp.]